MSDFQNSSLNPKNWFLKGKNKARFDARQHFYDESLERALADIDYEGNELAIAHLELDKKYRRLSEIEYEKKMATILFGTDTTETKLAWLDLDKKYNAMTEIDYEKKRAVILTGLETLETKLAWLEINRKYKIITDKEFAKETATLRNEPYVSVDVHTDPAKPSEGDFEMDWNDRFISDLIDAGYVAETQEQIIKLWIDQICANVAKENGAIFPEELDEFEFRKAAARKVKSKDGRTEIL
jgi:hypothetical protein